MNISIEGVKGKGLKDQGKQGRVVVEMGNSSYSHERKIVIDGFEGRGEEYKERETEAITITDGIQVYHYKSFDELVKAIRGNDFDLSAEQKAEGIELFRRLNSANVTNNILTVTNDRGIPFNVRMIFEGQKYGRTGGLIHDSKDPLVEFYDARDKYKFGELGQFVNRYFAITLFRDEQRLQGGLRLDAGSDNWYVTGDNMREVYSFIRGQLLDRKEV